MTLRCGKRYGKRNRLICGRLANHAGQHRLRLMPDELAYVLRLRRG